MPIHGFSVDMDPHKRQMSVPTDQESMAVGSKDDSKEIDWSITPIEVWASSGEAFVQLSECLHFQKRIFVYKNQETPSGSVLVWGESLDAILEEARVKLNCQKMPAKLCTLDGEKVSSIKSGLAHLSRCLKPHHSVHFVFVWDQVTRLTDLKQDQLVCLLCSGERFVPNGMHPTEIKANWTRARQTYGSDSTEVVVQSRENPLVGVDPFATTNTNLHKSENLQSDLKRINVYENGKPIRTAQPITGDSLNQLLERTTILLRLPQTAVCFYTRDGMKVRQR
ncbi:uncharacterized protein DEA37_0011598 [Paragonimus westermani]|uniref:Doublecortin domain-containing protein n=1 Tax=Paragonimus westermani TaxID=34504 RepID=A0A5J4P270_9TREM|nr:uncharacterized protein DEA37_0011598 [Paragonimus westermani]